MALKSLASRLFTQPFIQAQIKENIKALRHWPLCGNSTLTGDFLAQKSSNAENVSIWWRHHDKINLNAVSYPSRSRYAIRCNGSESFASTIFYPFLSKCATWTTDTESDKPVIKNDTAPSRNLDELLCPFWCGITGETDATVNDRNCSKWSKIYCQELDLR